MSSRGTLRWTLCVLPLVAAACSSDSNGPEPGPPVVTELTCRQEDGQLTACRLERTERSIFTIKLVSRDCQAVGNIVRVVYPSELILTNNGCQATVGRTWTFGPVDVVDGVAAIGLEVEAPSFPNPASLIATRTSEASWTLEFEDGADDDHNDLVFTVQASAAP